MCGITDTRHRQTTPMKIHRFLDSIRQTAMIWKPSLGCALAWAIARFAGSNHPYLAPLTVVLCLQATPDRSVQSSWQRMIGTVIGVAIATVIVNGVGVSAWTVGMIVFISILIGKQLKLDDMIIHQVGVSAILVLVFENHSVSYALDRIVDTAIGIVVAIILDLFIFPPRKSSLNKTRHRHF